MAGRIERRINDKFYFVLDEVGGSSDCETDLPSDANSLPTDDLAEPVNVTTHKDTRARKHNASLDDLGNTSPNNEESLLQHSNALDEDEGERKRGNGNCSVTSRSPPRNKYNLCPEESSTPTDMDLDSDVGSSQPKMKPLLRITFRDEATEKRLKSSLFKFIFEKFGDSAIMTNNENSLEIEVYDKDPRKLLEDDLLDFDLDTTPGDSHVVIPNYGKSHDLLLSDKSVEDKQSNGKLSAGAATCFNCLGNHVLRDCPEEKDFRVISKNRLKFQEKKEKLSKTSRYHLDENQKFSHLVPGMISKKLRNALNLRRDQQPGFIYKMRQLGYPPAWLEEAKVSHSGVTMYDDTGVPVLEEDEEEGEIVPEGAKDKFDISKIIEFPGFNVPLPSSFKDQIETKTESEDPFKLTQTKTGKIQSKSKGSPVNFLRQQNMPFFYNITSETKYYQCPAYSEEHSKQSLIKLLEPKTVQAYVKKSLTSHTTENKSSPQSNSKRTSSPTIEEMEEKKRQLLMELNSEDGKAPSVELSSCRTPPPNEPRINKKVGTVTNLEFGTPILKSVSPFSKLPTREQFSCNVSDVINFENLPNSTGKYETMREVISKIRISTSKSQKE